MGFESKLSVTKGLDHLALRLDPIIRFRLPVDLGTLPWTAVLSQLDDLDGKHPKKYATTDLQCQLRMLTRRLGKLGFPFDDNRQTAGTLGRELTIVRNAWAHGDGFSTLDAWRAHDYMVRLLEYFDDCEGLVAANEFRHEALVAFIAEAALAAIPVQIPPAKQGAPAYGETPIVARADESDASRESEPEPVRPDLEVFSRELSSETTLVGNARPSFDPWVVVQVGDIAVLDELPRLAAKQKVRAVAVEITEAEGPVHLDRLTQLVAASFGLQKVHSSRATRIATQVRAAGLTVDLAKFVWPDTIDVATWTEFRPNSSEVTRQFLHISPREIANAYRFLQKRHPDASEVELEVATLQTFGRKRRTKAFASHLARSKLLK
ncbi:hypothetical protein ASC59_11040 [Leifsonia sp. Root1293]|nr:hypothetical protein ASC59_11040 [Leifsonia sp. Root1293]KRA12846.1 hypothetical protein ASD61_11040 [Leifsonia sp. Root60]